MDWMLSDNRKIGGFMLCFGILFMFLGVIFFFDKALLALGNILFLGVRNFFLNFFTHWTNKFLKYRKEKKKGRTA